MRLVARVPATSANLGPGFDCLALALDLCNEVTIDTEAEHGVSWEGEGWDELPTDGSDLVSRAMRRVAERSEEEFLPFHLHGVNRIPLERGLGSSSAAAVAGIALARAWLRLPEPVDRRELIFDVAAEFEGHPDNAAAAVYGGFTLATGGSPPVRLDPHPTLRPVLLIPERLRLPTDEARRALPSQVPWSDAAFNVGRAAMVVVALTRRPELLGEALEDRLHQDVRLGLVPEAREVYERLRSERVPVCISGAGPSLLAFEQEGWTVPEVGPGWRILRVRPRATGVEVDAASPHLSPGRDRPM